MLRALPSVVLIAAGTVAGTSAFLVAKDLTLFSILTGVASTAIASGLVDGSAVHERHRQAVPVRQIAARRIGQVHQTLLSIVQLMFDDVTAARASDWPSALRAIAEGPIDLRLRAAVFPPRQRVEYLRDLYAELSSTLDELNVLAAAGVLSAEANRLDSTVRNSNFVSLVGAALAVPLFQERLIPAAEAASVLEAVQSLLPAAAKSAGATWRYGKL